MTTEIYYFSGTGNSLVVARDIAERIGGRLTAIPSLPADGRVEPSADRMGIVFPAYYMRLPGIVERFVSRCERIEDKYLFAVATVGGISGDVLERLSSALEKRGGRLAAGFVVRMPPNYIHEGNALPAFIERRILGKWAKRADGIAAAIRNEERGLQRRFNPIATFLFSGQIERSYAAGELRPESDVNFRTDGRCRACGTCAKVCPVENIEMVDGPVWKRRCEKCLACIQWCPVEAIQYGDVTKKRRRYHHPSVKVADMIKR